MSGLRRAQAESAHRRKASSHAARHPGWLLRQQGKAAALPLRQQKKPGVPAIADRPGLFEAGGGTIRRPALTAIIAV